MGGGIGGRPERQSGTRGAKNDSRKKCQSGRKRVSLRVPKRQQKGRRNKTGVLRRRGGKNGGEKGHKRAAPHPETKALVWEVRWKSSDVFPKVFRKGMQKKRSNESDSDENVVKKCLWIIASNHHPKCLRNVLPRGPNRSPEFQKNNGKSCLGLLAGSWHLRVSES